MTQNQTSCPLETKHSSRWDALISRKWTFLVIGLFILLSPKIDLYVSSLFYTPSPLGKGTFYNNSFFQFLFRYGEYFGLGTGVITTTLCFLSFFVTSWKKIRKPMLAMALTLVLGAGLFTNSLFKEYWGRPRPKQIVEFGGNLTYRPFWNPNFKQDRASQKSFPSGHVAMGFYFFSLCLIGRRYKKFPLFLLGLFLTIGLGGGLMVARIVQGGHFVSDVVASIFLMWFVAFYIDKILHHPSQLQSLL